MKITVTRSFSKKVQLKQFEPIDSFCGASMEMDDIDGGQIVAKLEEASALLDELCRAEVEKTLHAIRPSLKAATGKSQAEKKDIVKEEALFDAGSTADDIPS